DFGLAKRLDNDTEKTRAGAILGTPSYMAPEQAQSRPEDIGPATDVYALGVLLYEMLTGRPPFQATQLLDLLEQVRRDEPVAPSRLQPRVPRDVNNICLTCLRKEPSQRYATALALAEDLRAFLAGAPVQARVAGKWERAGRWLRRRPAA